MRNSKRLLIALLALIMAMPTMAQFETHRKRSRYNHNDTERYYGARLGLNIASMSSEYAGYDMDSRSGLAFGGVIGWQLANQTPLWLETGLFYSEKGGKTHWTEPTEDGPSINEKVTVRLSYFEVPIVVKYSFDTGVDDLYVQPFLGGYLALGIGGKTKEYGEYNANTHQYRGRSSYSSFDNFNRFDGGLRIGCGAEYKMVYGELGFDFGLANVSKGDFDTTHTRNFFINVGVNF